MTILITAAKETMPDPDLEIRGRGWGEGGGGVSPQKIVWDLRSSVWSKYKGRGGGGGPPPPPPPPPGPSPGSANEQEGFWITLQVCHKAHDLFSCSPVLLSPGTD